MLPGFSRKMQWNQHCHSSLQKTINMSECIMLYSNFNLFFCTYYLQIFMKYNVSFQFMSTQEVICPGHLHTDSQHWSFIRSLCLYARYIRGALFYFVIYNAMLLINIYPFIQTARILISSKDRVQNIQKLQTSCIFSYRHYNLP